MIFEELVDIERSRQEEKWGEQNHTYPEWKVILGEELGEADKAFLGHYFGNADNEQVLIELIHASAVLKAMYESLVRNGYSQIS